jgi:hypothetical protein
VTPSHGQNGGVADSLDEAKGGVPGGGGAGALTDGARPTVHPAEAGQLLLSREKKRTRNAHPEHFY